MDIDTGYWLLNEIEIEFDIDIDIGITSSINIDFEAAIKIVADIETCCS